MKAASIILHYSSVFDRYQSYDDIQGGSWRDANDAVGPSDVRLSPADGMKQHNAAPGMERHDMSIESASVGDPSPEQKSSTEAGFNHPGVKP
ncbi:hypothetical protein FCL47_21170 [Desulfopila sp. IMCC35006]|uniref:hypothetical protein n=1 Tax=Desulfopila sp. IMCC35006 TaxID=2569542 RepID=UPI0010AB9470|nr:hypothetical protein [Desulfopila sp. IMCC35006]TKB23705.1 hypothetical protein FCL47_21170 [Desulfopila sp. IMCC35006]